MYGLNEVWFIQCFVKILRLYIVQIFYTCPSFCCLSDVSILFKGLEYPFFLCLACVYCVCLCNIAMRPGPSVIFYSPITIYICHVIDHLAYFNFYYKVNINAEALMDVCILFLIRLFTCFITCS